MSYAFVLGCERSLSSAQQVDGPLWHLRDDPQTKRLVMDQLRAAGTSPTSQRRLIGAMLLGQRVYFTAEHLVRAVQAQRLPISRSTIYNTLHLFTRRGLLRALAIGGVDTVYDFTLSPRHHFFDVDMGEVNDIELDWLQIAGLDALLASLQVEGVDLVVRGRRWRFNDKCV